MEFGGIVKREETYDIDSQEECQFRAKEHADKSVSLSGITHPHFQVGTLRNKLGFGAFRKGIIDCIIGNKNRSMNEQNQSCKSYDYSELYRENGRNKQDAVVKQEIASPDVGDCQLDGIRSNHHDEGKAMGSAYYGFVLATNKHSEVKSEREVANDECFVSYACSHCTMTFSSAMDLWDHQKSCAVQSEFSCGICGKNFNNRTALRKHQYIHTDEKKFLCTECGMRFNSNGNLKRHKRIHTGERPYSCDVCNKSFAQVTTLKNHMTTHTNDRPYECEVCKKRFPRKGHLTGHMGTHIDFHGGPLKLYINRSPEGSAESSNSSNKTEIKTDFIGKDVSAVGGIAAQSFSVEITQAPMVDTQSSSGEGTLPETVVVAESHLENSGLIESAFTGKLSESASEGLAVSEKGVFESVGGGTVSATTDVQQQPISPMIDKESVKETNDVADIQRNATLANTEENDQVHHLKTRQGQESSTGEVFMPKKEQSCEESGEGSVYVSFVEGSTASCSDTPAQSSVRKTTFSPDETVIVGTIFTGNRIVNVKHFRCNFCGKILTSSNHLKEHKLIHTGGKPHRCQYCDKSFRNSGNLRRHERTHTGVRPYQCKLCSKSFTQAGTLKNHMYTHTKLKPFLCYECGEGFTRNRNLKDHVRAVHAKERPFACPFCNHRTFRQDRLNKHIDAIHGGKKGYVCNVCGRYFKTIKAVEKHKVKHRLFVKRLYLDSKPRLTSAWQRQKQSDLMRYSCKICDLKFAAYCYYNSHRTHHLLTSRKKRKVIGKGEPVEHSSVSESEGLMDISEVSKVRNLENEVAKLKFRMNDARASVRQMLPCKQCERLCSPSGCFSRFMACHKCIPMLSCAECDKNFLWPNILKWHMKVFHRTEKAKDDYTCSLCQKHFRNPTNFILHRQHHERKLNQWTPRSKNGNLKGFTYIRKYRLSWGLRKQYTCVSCMKTFTFLGKLKQHEKHHTTSGKRMPLRDATTCSICKQKFSHAGALYSHMKTHASRKERPHKCQFCHKKFLRPSHLKEHVLRHADKKFACAVCDKMFYTNRSLRRHESSHKNLNCEICSERFDSMDEKRCHVQDHLVRTCNSCHEEFSSKGDLEDHSLTCGTEKMLYLCQLCGESFCDIVTLEAHQRSHSS